MTYERVSPIKTKITAAAAIFVCQILDYAVFTSARIHLVHKTF